jgi:hypothetical protein
LSSTSRTLSAVLLLTLGCSDQGFSIFGRDPCRRDPAACPPDEEPGICVGASASGEPIDQRVCDSPGADFRAVKFWEHRPEVAGGSVPGPRQLFTASLDGGPSEPLLSIARMNNLDGGRAEWVFLRGRDGGEVVGFAGNWNSTSGLLIVDHDLKPWARGQVNWEPVLMSPQGVVRPQAPTPPGSTQADGALMFGDFTGDGGVEMFGGTSVYDLDGNELVRTLDDRDRSRTAVWDPVADVTGDGRRELLTYRGYLNERGHYHCRVDDKWAYFRVLDVDFDGRPEVLVTFAPADNGDERVAILDGSCNALREIVLHNAIPNGGEVPRNPVARPFLVVAPLLQRNSPAFAIPIVRQDRDTGQVFSNRSAVFDHELNFIRELYWAPGRGASVAADLNGDGVFEIIVTEWRDERDNRIVGPAVVDARTGKVTVLDDVADVGQHLVYADIDGDGRGEIVVSVRDHDGQWYIRAYKGAGPGFAAAWPFEYYTQAPYLHNPDGTPSREPVRYDRLAMFNAMPSGGWWVGMNSDLRVRFTDVCDEDCSAGSLTFTVQVGNHGYGDVGNDVLVSVYGERGGERTLLSEQRYRDVNAGQWNDAEPVTVRFQGEPFDRLRAVVTGDGYDVQECDTDNNEAVWNLDCR